MRVVLSSLASEVHVPVSPSALATTVEWYRSREDWWRPIKSGEFRVYYEKQYSAR